MTPLATEDFNPTVRRHMAMVDESCTVESRADGSLLVHRNETLLPYKKRYTEWLMKWADEAPDRVFLAQRPPATPLGQAGGGWETWTYAAVWAAVQCIGQALLDRGLSRERPVMVLSENQVENQLLALACTHVGVTYIPVAPAYSLLAQDHAHLKWLGQFCRPGLVYSSTTDYRAAVGAAFPGVEWVVSRGDGAAGATAFSSLLATAVTPAVAAAFDAISADDPVKVLFTSGTTGQPKGVVQTHRVACSNRQQLIQSLPLVFVQPPVVVDWMPWHHTFGGTHVVGLVLCGGGTLHIDRGLPVPDRIEETVASLRDVAPTFYASTPGGMAMLLPYLQADAALRNHFFSRLDVMQYGGAPLPAHVRRGFDEVMAAAGGAVSFLSGLGSTECGPHVLGSARDPGCELLIGVPVAGTTLKLAPVGDQLELRCKGPSIAPCYWKQPDLTRQAFDEEGFFKLSDAVSFVDPPHPELGLRFEGRLSENFKLSTGTWVVAAKLREAAIDAFAPWVREVVIAGEGRDHVGALVFPDIERCRALDAALSASASAEEVLASATVREALQQRLNKLAASGLGSAGRVVRIMLEPEPPVMDTGELTAKQSVSAITVLRRRSAAVQQLFEAAAHPRVLVAA